VTLTPDFVLVGETEVTARILACIFTLFRFIFQDNIAPQRRRDVGTTEDVSGAFVIAPSN
jgi:hypothetical protein